MRSKVILNGDIRHYILAGTFNGAAGDAFNSAFAVATFVGKKSARDIID